MPKKFTEKGWKNITHLALNSKGLLEFSISLYLPDPYDLVYIIVKEQPDKKIIGWYTGSEWMGLKLKPHHTVIAWKKHIKHLEP